MAQETIFLPMLALAVLTFTALFFIPLRRFRAAFAGHVKPEDFALGESANVPAKVALANRNYMNLLELPQLFYVVALAMYVTQTVDGLAIQLAWAFVGLRVLHTLVHITFNNVFARLIVFTLSNVALMGLWVVFGLRVCEAAAA